MAVISSVSDLIDFSDLHRSGRWIYRGQTQKSSDGYPLKPKVARHSDTVKHEERIFSMFKTDGAMDLQSGISEWEMLALAQHHGLPTRLLDWSEVSAISLYFACLGKYDTNGALYALNLDKVYSVGDEDFPDSPFSPLVSEVRRFRPRHVTSRLSAQRGLFTIHPNPGEELAVHDNRLHEVEIDKNSKEEILWDLSRYFNINHRSLFPDVDGSAHFITWSMTNTDPKRRT